MRAWLWCGLVLGGCQPALELQVEPVTGVEVGAAFDAGAVPSECADLRVESSEVELRARVEGLVSALRSHGSTARIDSISEPTRVASVNWPLGAVDDPSATAALELERLGLGLPPVSELEVEVKSVMSGAATAIFSRRRIGAEPTAFFRPAFTASLNQGSAGWRISSVTVYPSVAFATRVTRDGLARCTGASPPDDTTVRSTTFTGLRLRFCAEVGSYSYRTNPGDVVTWEGASWWEPGTFATNALPTQWRVVRQAKLVVHPDHFWPSINEADCNCAGRVGFTLVVDAVTGVVVRYQPGLGCVVC